MDTARKYHTYRQCALQHVARQAVEGSFRAPAVHIVHNGDWSHQMHGRDTRLLGYGRHLVLLFWRIIHPVSVGDYIPHINVVNLGNQDNITSWFLFTLRWMGF